MSIYNQLLRQLNNEFQKYTKKLKEHRFDV